MRRTDLLADRHDQLRKKFDPTLGDHVRQKIAILGDPAYLRTFAGQVTWATTVNLVGRLYKGVKEVHLSLDSAIERLNHVFFPNNEACLKDASLRLLSDLSEGEGHYIVHVSDRQSAWDESWVVLFVGQAHGRAKHQVSVAGNGWLAFLNSDAWIGLAVDPNPIGPIVAGCQAVAEVYRMLYAPKGNLSGPVAPSIFSAFDYGFYNSQGVTNPPLPPSIELPLTHIAGAGAGGTAFLFLLESLPIPTRSDGIWLVDKDHLDGTSFNRNMLAIPQDEGKEKVKVAVQRLDVGRLSLKPYYGWWKEFLDDPIRGTQEDCRFVVSCVDRYESRRSVQYDCMPKLIFTTGTGDFLLTVSRHQLDDGLACALCYQPRQWIGPHCGGISEATQRAFEAAIEPSIGFVSVLSGVLLASEFLKEVIPSWRAGRIKNTIRYQMLTRRSKVLKRPKEESCGCTSPFVTAAYRQIWGKIQQANC